MYKFGLFLCLGCASVALGQQYSITTVAGGAPPPTPVAGTSTTIGQPKRVVLDGSGNLYFSSGNSVFKLNGSTLALVAGNSRPGYSGDGGAAVNAQLNSPQGLALDASGNLYIADSLNNRVRIVSPQGIIKTFAGNGTVGYINAVGDGGLAPEAQLLLPSGVAVDSNGNVYIADTGDNLIRIVATTGIINTIAGIGYPGFLGDGSVATASSLNHPEDVAVDSSNNIFIADTLNGVIRKITSDGNINTVVGSSSSIGYAGDGGAATSAGLIEPFAVVVDSKGQIYIAEPADGRIRMVDTKGNINTIAGTGTNGFGGDGGDPTKAQLNLPTGVAVDSSGNLYIADSLNARVREMAGSAINTIAGNGGLSYSGDGGPGTKAQLNSPQAVATDGAGNLYIADTANNVVRKVASGGTISTILGNGTAGSGNSQLNGPQGVAADSAGNVYVSDTQNARVLKISGGAVTTVAGSGKPGFGGDGSSATSAQLNTPVGLAVDSAGNLYIADFGNNRIRKVTPGNTISTVAGTAQGFGGDGGLATAAQLNAPQGVALDKAGNLYITDTLNNRLRVVSNGIISTVAGTGTAGLAGDGGPATSAQLVSPAGIAVDGAGNIFISDTSTRIRRVTPGGPIVTVGGGPVAGYSGDGGLATNAALNGPSGLAIDSKGNLYVADTNNNAVRMLQPMGSGITAAAVVGAASNALGAIAPGEVLVLYGSGMGPAQTAVNRFNSQGVLGTNVGGTSVLVNGVPAPMLYAGATQVSFIVPYATNGQTARIYVSANGQVSNPLSAAVAAAAPGIFTVDFSGKGQAAAVNQDGSVNGPSHPVKAGSYVSLYLTGAGQTNPPGTDGAQNVVPLPQPVGTVTVSIGGQSTTYNYAGAAPNSVAGVMQVNALVPGGLAAGSVPVVVTVGGVPSQPGVTITVN